jgi:hypothetical protein
VQYPVTTLIAVFSVIGGNVALGVASLVTSFGFNWRIAFWIGAGVAVIGAIARTRLRETPDFVDFKRKAKKYLEVLNRTPEHIEAVLNYPTFQEKVNKTTLLSLFLIQCSWPVCFYFVYIHCGHILKDSFGYSAEQVIHQNFIVSMMNLLGYLIITYLSYRIHPLKIIKVKLIIFSIFILICPYLLSNIKTANDLFLIQSFIMLFILSAASAMSVMYSHIPIFKRFTYAGLMFALSRAIMHVITSFGLVYLVEYFGHWGLLVIMIPVCIGFGFAVFHFQIE